MVIQKAAFLCVECAQQHYAIPLENVVRIAACTGLPEQAEETGRISLFSLDESVDGLEILMQAENTGFRVHAGRVTDVAEIPYEDIYEVPPEMLDDTNRYLAGVAYWAERECLLLVPDARELLHCAQGQDTQAAVRSALPYVPCGADVAAICGEQLHLRLGATHFALPTEKVCEILTEYRAIQTPGGKPWVYGVLYDGEQVLPVFCPGAVPRDKAPQAAVICRNGRGKVAFLASEVKELFTVDEETQPKAEAAAPEIPGWTYLPREGGGLYLPGREIWEGSGDSING